MIRYVIFVQENLKKCVSFNPSTNIDFLNAWLVYYGPLSTLMVRPFVSISLCDMSALSIDIMAFSFTANKSNTCATHSLVNTSNTLNRYPHPSVKPHSQ